MNRAWDRTFRSPCDAATPFTRSGLDSAELERRRLLLRSRQRWVILRSLLRFAFPTFFCAAFGWDIANYGVTVSAFLILTILILFAAWAVVTKPGFDADILELRNDRDALRRAYEAREAGR
jgi:hypothetical protein